MGAHTPSGSSLRWRLSVTQNTNSPTPDRQRAPPPDPAHLSRRHCAGGARRHRLRSSPPSPPTPTRHPSRPAVQTAANPSSGFADLIASVRPAVVSVKVELEQPVSMNGTVGGGNGLPFNPFAPFGMPGIPQMPQGGQHMVGEGSGFFISSDGYVVTANHVVDHAQQGAGHHQRRQGLQGARHRHRPGHRRRRCSRSTPAATSPTSSSPTRCRASATGWWPSATRSASATPPPPASSRRSAATST